MIPAAPLRMEQKAVTLRPSKIPMAGNFSSPTTMDSMHTLLAQTPSSWFPSNLNIWTKLPKDMVRPFGPFPTSRN